MSDKMQVNLSRRRCELILRGLQKLEASASEYANENPAAKEYYEEIVSLREMVESRLEPLPPIEEEIL